VKRHSITHEFVDFVPDELEEGVVYVTVRYATAVHRCCCGCGNEVITPLSPTDWKLIFDGETISLDPSIGNWSFPCQSHYWLRRNKIVWAGPWSREQIEAGRARDRALKAAHADSPGIPGEAETPPRKQGSWKRLWRRGTPRRQHPRRHRDI
jgi:hypothetical protein